MEWNKLIDKEPMQRQIILLTYLVDNEWKIGFSYYLRPRSFYISKFGEETYWVYAKGLSINIGHPYDQPERSKREDSHKCEMRCSEHCGNTVREVQ